MSRNSISVSDDDAFLSPYLVLTKCILGDGSKARSMSDQPASCPLCGAILRQSRNLRRHLELLHFGLGNGSKSGMHARHRRPDRPNDFTLSSLACARPTARIDSHLARSSEASDFPMMTPLSITSSVSSASSVSLSGEPRASREMSLAIPKVFSFISESIFFYFIFFFSSIAHAYANVRICRKF